MKLFELNEAGSGVMRCRRGSFGLSSTSRGRLRRLC